MKTSLASSSLVLSTVAALCLVAGSAAAKLPAPSDDAKAKAAVAAAKTAHGNKVADFQLCKSMDKVAAKHLADAKKAGKTLTPTPTPPCADPGPFVSPDAAPAATVAAAAPAPAAPKK